MNMLKDLKFDFDPKGPIYEQLPSINIIRYFEHTS